LISEISKVYRAVLTIKIKRYDVYLDFKSLYNAISSRRNKKIT